MRIGLILGVFSSSYCSNALNCIAQEIEKRHARLVIFEGRSLENNTSNDYMCNTLFRLIRCERLDGLIILSSTLICHGGKDLIEHFASKIDVPVVSIGLALEGISSVIPENAVGIEKLMSHLISHSYIKFAFIGGPPSHPEAIVRQDAFLQVISRNGLYVPPNLIFEGTYGFMSGYSFAKRLIPYVKDQSVDAVVCASDEMAFAVEHCFSDNGLRIPEDVAVSGFDGSDLTALSSPPLTTINLRFELMSEKAVTLLFELIFGRKNIQVCSIEPEILVRQSRGCELELFKRNKLSFSYLSAHLLNGRLQSLATEDLFIKLTHYLEEHSILQCYIVRYTEPLPFDDTAIEQRLKATLYYGYFKGHRIHHPKAFPAVNLLPEHILDKNSEPVLVRPLYFGKLQFGFLIISACAPSVLIDDLGQELCHCLGCLYLHEERALAEKKLADAHESLMISNKRLNELMVKDNLDKLSNIRYLAANMLQNRKISNGEYILIIVEIDNLTDINFRFGFNEGEHVITSVSNVLASSIRDDDFLSHQSCERYVILVKNIQNDPIKTIEKRFIHGFYEMNKCQMKDYTVKLSWGSSFASTDADFDSVYQQAERNLMEARKHSR